MTAPALDRGTSATRASSIARFIPAVLAVVLLAAMLFSTKFLTAAEVEAITPKPFNAAEFVATNYDKALATVTDKGTDLTTLAPAVLADKAAAAEQYHGVNLGAGSYAFPVKATGTVKSADANFIILDVANMPPGSTVRIPVGAALNGTPVRDAAGYKFADFPGQTQYQQVANEFKTKMAADVLSTLDPAALTGKTLTVVGAYSLPGAANSYIIQPMQVTQG